ncbi:uncharacterized protein RCC_07137 [Ramularia collo-cygni]|uniref:Glycosyl transferase CAP10 domain-containing protein n=1 Tax=Ramularia collo-cygni TaxID=112498 RepID=A0A2D3VEJ2_9PEZI|nr:uncharacterized protein RCC_07137 [Ramularia collo-cygni]CZT21274.1 uncharacterized protein RCC_07137 [Ramularia collo-cygni]
MENLLTWKRFSFLLLGLLTAIILWPTTKSAYEGFNLPKGPAISSLRSSELPLDAHHDIVDTLTADQCDSAFPGLFYEVDRAAEHFRESRTSITKEDVNITWRYGEEGQVAGAMRILIHDNQLRILETRQIIDSLGYAGRGLPLLNMLQRAVDSATAGGEKLPTIEAAIIVEDISDPPENGTHSFWTFARSLTKESHQRLWLVPNFDFYVQSEGAFEEVRRRGAARDAPFTEKIQKAIWRGQAWVNHPLRDSLLDAGKGKPWADFIDTQMDHTAWLKPDEVCKYAMNVHTEGVSYSGRLASLSLCNSLTFVHDLEWTAHFYNLLKPDGPEQNYVPVKRDWTDLEEKIQHYMNNPREAEKIIQNSVDVLRSKALSRAGTSCYFRKLIQGYSTVSFTPEVYRPVKQGQLPRRRGLSFEAFMTMRNDLHHEDMDLLDVLEGINAGTD